MNGRIPQSFIDDLLARVDLVEVIDSRVPLKKAGREYKACCPFHDEKTPSFTVSPSKQFYHCFGCGAHGSAIGFLMEYEHLGFVEAIEELAGRAGLEVPREGGTPGPSAASGPRHAELYPLLERAARFFQAQLRRHPQAGQAVEYLKGRGVSGEIAQAFGLGFAPPGWHNLGQALADAPAGALVEAGLLIEKDDGKRYDRFRERVMFPIRDRRGRVIGFGGRVLGDGTPKYLNSPETPVFHKGRELYGLYEARQASRELARLLVVEGYMDVVALAQFGIRNAVATLGTAVTDHHLQLLFRATSELVFCFDGDRAGREAAWRAVEEVLPLLSEGRQVRIFFLPEGEDPDTLVRHIGAERFASQAAAAPLLSEFVVDQLAARADLSRLDGQVRLVELAKPLLSKMPQGVYRSKLVEDLAAFAKLTTAQRDTLPGEARAAGGAPRPAARPQAAQPQRAPSPTRHAVALLVQNPQLATLAGEAARFGGIRLPGVALLSELLALLQQRPELTTGALLEHFRGRDEFRHLALLAGQELVLRQRLDRPTEEEEREELEREFVETLQRIEEERRSQRKEELMRKPFAALTGAEKLELQQLLRA